MRLARGRLQIVGGGEGATLREVLRYQSVKKVYMVELDEAVSRLSYLCVAAPPLRAAARGCQG